MDWRAQVGGLKNRRSTSGPARPVYNEPMLKAEPVEEPVAVGERNLKPTSGVTISESLPPQYPTMHPELAPDPHVEHAQTEAQPSKIEESVKVARSDYESNEPMRVGGLLLSQTFDQIEEEGLLVTDKDPLDQRVSGALPGRGYTDR